MRGHRGVRDLAETREQRGELRRDRALGGQPPGPRLGQQRGKVRWRSVEVYRFEGDKIAEEWVAPDLMGLMAQISA
ncbi:ester cyclase [Promicromonospora sp. Populi]|uniref:ester cyclase n=1 Tax=Promicromonospora sp. Populi TaxID=3239420 RepID=UPI0034E1C933